MWISRARPPADRDLADAVHRLERAANLLVGDLGERPEAIESDDTHQRHDRIRVGIDLRDDRRQDLGGSADRAATFSRTSCAASLMSRSSTNRTVIAALPSLMRARISSMPAMLLSACSIGSTTEVAISSGLRPAAHVDGDRRRIRSGSR